MKAILIGLLTAAFYTFALWLCDCPPLSYWGVGIGAGIIVGLVCKALHGASTEASDE